MALDLPTRLPNVPEPLRRNYRDHFLRVMERNKFHRSERPGKGPNGEPNWMIFERQKLYFEVNQERAKWGKRPMSMGPILQVEKQANGDERKFAWYLACLVVDTA